MTEQHTGWASGSTAVATIRSPPGSEPGRHPPARDARAARCAPRCAPAGWHAPPCCVSWAEGAEGGPGVVCLVMPCCIRGASRGTSDSSCLSNLFAVCPPHSLVCLAD